MTLNRQYKQQYNNGMALRFVAFRTIGFNESCIKQKKPLAQLMTIYYNLFIQCINVLYIWGTRSWTALYLCHIHFPVQIWSRLRWPSLQLLSPARGCSPSGHIQCCISVSQKIKQDSGIPGPPETHVIISAVLVDRIGYDANMIFTCLKT